jgi:hypothetical protein
MVTAVLREASCERGGREQRTCANLFAWYLMVPVKGPRVPCVSCVSRLPPVSFYR